ncbi:MAG: HlyD family efflux transporter periplasmic adaptor subunit [Pseudomonadota bacterium]
MAIQPIREPASDVKGIRDTAAQDEVIKPRRGGRWVKWGGAAVIGIAAVIWAINAAEVWLKADVTVDRDRLRIATVTRGDLVRDIPIQGVIVAAIKPTLFAPSAGRVTLEVSAGQTVRQGDILASIESPQLASELQQAQALLASEKTTAERANIEARQTALENQQAVDLAEVEVTAAERELRRAEKSWEYQVISKQDLEEAVDNLARARLEFEHRKADAALFLERRNFEARTREYGVEQQALRVTELERQVAALAITSPVDGIVGSLSVEDRAAVSADAPLLNVVDLSRLELEVALSQSYADDVQVGMPAEISYSGETFPAIVSAISPEVAQNTVATRLRFADIQPPGLRQNQRLTGKIRQDTVANALLLPRGPFFDNDGGRAAYLVNDNFLERRTIVVGATSSTHIQILDGLSVGDQVVVSTTTDFDAAPQVLIVD